MRRDAKTVKCQRLQIGAFVRLYSSRHPEEITTDDLRRFVRLLSEKELSPQTINKYISSLKNFFEFCILEGYTDRNPALRIRALKEEKRIVEALSRSELYQVINCRLPYKQAKRRQWERDHILMMLLSSTGLRPSELCGIQWQDISFEDQSLIVRAEVGKGGKERKIFLINETASLLFYYYESLKPQPNNYLFYGIYQHFPISPRTVNDIFKKILIECGITRFRSPRVYLLRKSYITNLIKDGVSIESVSSLAGHSNPYTTFKYYREAQQFEEIKQELEQKFFMNHTPKSSALDDYQKKLKRTGYIVKKDTFKN